MDSEKFSDVPVEPETNILFQATARIDDLEVLYQKWSWEGIHASSVIFAEEDARDLSDEDVRKLVASTALPELGTKYTINRAGGYVFVSLNFVEP